MVEEGGDGEAAAGDTPIGDYAVVGDCHGAALVSKDASVDWCCLGRFDADPVFCRLLDRGRGGFLELRPDGPFEAMRSYLGDTNVLRTVFRSADGSAEVAVTDFMPVGRKPGSGANDYVSLAVPGVLVRLVEGLAGRAAVSLRYRPSVEFAARPARLSAAAATAVACEGGPVLSATFPLEVAGSDTALGRFTVAAGERHCVWLGPGAMAAGELVGDALALLGVTRAFWEEWIAYCRYDGPYREAVRRSALLLKLLTYAPTGAVVAAPTSSLPEAPGFGRNWDYRISWVRDASFSMYALLALGYGGEAVRYYEFLRRSYEGTAPDLQIMYGIDGRPEIPESELGHLAGHRGSRPVRKGNSAYEQRQIDVYGELLEGAHILEAVGGRHVVERHREFLGALADAVAGRWGEPDSGFWEIRGEPRHHVQGRMMSWVALDRAAKLLGDRPAWAAAREAVVADMLARGVDPGGGHLRFAYELDGVDGFMALLPLYRLPVPREVQERTVGAIERRLAVPGGLVRRYDVDDGLEGREGAFVACGFWLAEGLTALGRVHEARALFELNLSRRNDVGLLAEEVDPESGEALGNFPQALSHLSMVLAALMLRAHERQGMAGLEGSHADRARRFVGSVFGVRGVWEALVRSRHPPRLRSSRRSVMPDRFAASLAPRRPDVGTTPSRPGLGGETTPSGVAQVMAEDPRKAGPQPPQPTQKQDPPGLTSEMTPKPDHGEDSYKGSGKLQGRAAIVTGGDSGIGRAVCIAFAREGADVAVSYLPEEEEDAQETKRWVERAGRRCLLIPGDITDHEHCKSIVERSTAEFGRLDILVNNAAFQRTYEKIEDITAQEFDRTFRTNVHAMFYLCQAAVPRMKPGGSIVNTCSIQAKDPSPQLLAYASTKAAIVNFTAGLAQMLAERGIRVNAVAPGPIWTPLIPATMPAEKAASFGQQAPLKRAGQPAELAPAYVLLASDDGSYMTGAVVPVTGGNPML